VGIKTEGWICC